MRSSLQPARVAFYCHFDDRVRKDIFINDYPSTNEYVFLAATLRDNACEVHSLDIYQSKGLNPDLCIFLDLPPFPPSALVDISKTKALLILREPKTVVSWNFQQEPHQYYDRVLTFRHSLVDNRRYFPYYASRFRIEDMLDIGELESRRLSVMINSYLKSDDPSQLYSYRENVVRWFEANASADFDLYGHGWTSYSVPIRGSWAISLPRLRRLSTYRGYSQSKLHTLNKYKFAFCIENSVEEGYLSEKLFDALLSRCIPIYLGSPEVSKFIPNDLFVDLREYSDFQDLHQYLTTLPHKEIKSRIHDAKDFLLSEQAYPLTFSGRINTVKSAVLNLFVN